MNYPGSSSSLEELLTPCLILRESSFLENISAMARHCDQAGIALRPHAKTHKSAKVASIQIENGANGICCATLQEAELLAEEGISDILITSPIASEIAINRLVRLQEKVNRLACVIDCVENLEDLEGAFKGKNPLQVLCDIDPGMHRTGIALGPSAIGLIHRIVDSSNLEFKGIQYYAGNLMHVRDLAMRRKSVQQLWENLEPTLNTLEKDQIECEVISGGGTGTFNLDCQFGLINELQAGSYAFMDRDYLDIETDDSSNIAFKPSLFVLTRVVSNNVAGMATTDAGLKAFATDSGLPRLLDYDYSQVEYVFKGDEHGGLVFSDPDAEIAIGKTLLVIPPHCDPTVNLYEQMVVVDDNDTPIDVIRIDARSGNQLDLTD